MIELGFGMNLHEHAHASVIEAGIYGSRRVVLTDAGHLMYLEKPEGFSSVVMSFVESNLR